MFRILNITTGKEIGLTEEVRYIKRSPTSGCFIQAEKKDAIGIAFMGTPYNIMGKSEIEGADTVAVSPYDGGPMLYNVKESEESLAKQLAETDEAAIELYEANIALEQVNAEQDEAIIEIYEMIGETTNG